MDFLSGTKILEEVESPINGKITVVKSLGFGTYIQVENLTQSGGVVYDVWKSTLKQINKLTNQPINSCLILGLGGGNAALLVRKFWPEAEIVGVDIDPIMVELGNRHLGLGNSGVEVVIEDAYKFVKRQVTSNKKYNLILIDLYKGYEVPEKFKSEKFLSLARGPLAKQGVAIFNRLYFGEKRPEAMKFLQKLEKVFPKVTPIYPEANVMFVCQTDRI